MSATGAGSYDGVSALEPVFDAVADGVLVLDGSGIIVLANPAAARMFGRQGADLVGTDFGYPVPVGRTADIDVAMRGRNRGVEMRAAETEIDGRLYRVVTFRDVTQRQRAERHLRETIRVREELLALAVHELKTPVTVISGMALSLRDAWDDLDDSVRRNLIGRVAERSLELQDLVIEVLSRRSTDQWTADPSIELLEPLVRRAVEPWPDLDVRVDVDEELVVWADGGHVVEIIGNLVDNARKYGESPVTVSAQTAGEMVEIAVADRGLGVAADEQASMFELGWRSDSAQAADRDGSGLGLGIVRKLALANDGSVRYESPDGDVGARFVLRLPAGFRAH